MPPQKRVTGTRVDSFPPRRRARWDFSPIADGHVYLLCRGRHFDIQVDSLAAALRRWARENGYQATTRTKLSDEPNGAKVGLYVRLDSRR